MATVNKNILADPVIFAESMFGVRLWKTQKSILRAIQNNRRVAVKAAHSTGKTQAAALVRVCGELLNLAENTSATQSCESFTYR
jgi:hypothetical protein